MSTTSPTEQDLRYPVGRMELKLSLSDIERGRAIDTIASTPAGLRAAVDNLTDAQLDTPYRPGGWTVRQVVHHVADSHVNAYTRVRLALTEDNPTIKPYDEARWAELLDAATMPVDVSLTILDTIHHRLVTLIRSLEVGQYARTLTHPENGSMTVDALLGMYSWHGRHHTAHVTALRERMNWN